MDVPPGLRATIVPGGARGTAALDIVGGEITQVDFSGSVASSFESGNVQSSAQAFAPFMFPEAAFVDAVETVTAAFQVGLAGGSPALLVGVGSKFASGGFTIRFIDNAGSPVDQTNTDLEDLDWHMSARVGYF
jgi:hypothetical protein